MPSISTVTSEGKPISRRSSESSWRTISALSGDNGSDSFSGTSGSVFSSSFFWTLTSFAFSSFFFAGAAFFTFFSFAGAGVEAEAESEPGFSRSALFTITLIWAFLRISPKIPVDPVSTTSMVSSSWGTWRLVQAFLMASVTSLA